MTGPVAYVRRLRTAPAAAGVVLRRRGKADRRRSGAVVLKAMTDSTPGLMLMLRRDLRALNAEFESELRGAEFGRQ
jgi:hypothetical protein